jgi:WD40 repeat protein
MESRFNKDRLRKYGSCDVSLKDGRQRQHLTWLIRGSPNQGTWKCVGRLTQAHQSEVMSVSYAPAKAGHGRFASCGDALQIYREVLESTSEHPLFALEASSERMNLNAVRWHPRDGSMLATAGDDGKVRIWAYGRTPAPPSSKN